jgi:hypothetical protein
VDESIRIVDWSDGDGGFTKIFRVDAKGQYVPVAEVYPVVQDSSKPGVLLYNSDEGIADIILSHVGKALAVRGTYKRNAMSDDETDGIDSKLSPTLWPPLVLFTGENREPVCANCPDTASRINAREWRFITLDELAAKDRKRIDEQTRIAEEDLRRASKAMQKH